MNLSTRLFLDMYILASLQFTLYRCVNASMAISKNQKDIVDMPYFQLLSSISGVDGKTAIGFEISVKFTDGTKDILRLKSYHPSYKSYSTKYADTCTYLGYLESHPNASIATASGCMTKESGKIEFILHTTHLPNTNAFSMTFDGRFEQIKLDFAGRKDSVFEIPFDEVLPAESYTFRSKPVPYAIKVPIQIVYDKTFLEGLEFCGKDCGEFPDTYIDQILVHVMGIY